MVHFRFTEDTLRSVLPWLMLMVIPASIGWSAAPTFQQLMDPALFPKPQRGMVVESARITGNRMEVTTTGATFRMEMNRGELTCTQRLGHRRSVVRLHLSRPLQKGHLTHHGPGFARATFEAPKVTCRVNGDSLFMLHAHEPITVTVERLLLPAWESSFHNNHLIVDEWGGFGLYCSEEALADQYDPYADTVARYDLPADSVLWVTVFPPKPYDWKKSFKDNVIWHWSNQLGYPTDDDLRSWKDHGKTVLLQSEVMLWKDWNLDFVPRLGADEFARVRTTLHDLGMRFIVYTSPYYFLKGTALEGQAMNSFENFKGWPPGNATGENMEHFMEAITRVLKQYQPDGLYFDGQYIDSPAALYALARQTRALLGENGILEWHSTAALGYGLCYLPQADAYVDFVLRGEGQQSQYGNFDYMRFFVSGYNLHNSIGVLCNNGPPELSSELAASVLRANARLHTLASAIPNEKIMEVLREDYRARLNPQLRAVVDREANQRQALVTAQAQRRKAELAALKADPAWGKPTRQIGFDALPEGKQVVSPQNPSPFRVLDGELLVRGHAHTYAFLSLPVSGKAHGLVLRLRQGTDGGMSWGPGVLLRFTNGAALRLGTRSDGKLQADVMGSQLYGGSYEPVDWVWLRARWLERWGVIERSSDGTHFEKVWTFEHGGTFSGEMKELLLGKVPYNGEAQDFTEIGGEGECEIGQVLIYE
ncbi:MAG: hypothetical protein HY318_05315 [Armatimonadetes bacterium]|nr:hypothetical protein [Armatimonadota bacterium]